MQIKETTHHARLIKKKDTEMNPHNFLAENEKHLFLPDGNVRMYYPGGCTDYGPLTLFRDLACLRHVTAIYADYSVGQDQMFEFANEVGRKLESREFVAVNVNPSHFNVGGINHFYPKSPNEWSPEDARRYRPENQPSLGVRIVFLKISLTLIYLQSEAIQTLKILNKVRWHPNFVVLTEHGYGGYWTAFEGESLLFKAAKIKPEFLYVQRNAEPWPGYERVTEGSIDAGQMHDFERSLYKLRTKTKSAKNRG